MGIKIKERTEVIKVCPNQEKHTQDLVNKFKSTPRATFMAPGFITAIRHRSFCQQCGAKLIEKTIKHEDTVCETCAEAIYPSDSYCPHCGDKIH